MLELTENYANRLRFDTGFNISRKSECSQTLTTHLQKKQFVGPNIYFSVSFMFYPIYAQSPVSVYAKYHTTYFIFICSTKLKKPIKHRISQKHHDPLNKSKHQKKSSQLL